MDHNLQSILEDLDTQVLRSNARKRVIRLRCPHDQQSSLILTEVLIPDGRIFDNIAGLEYLSKLQECAHLVPKIVSRDKYHKLLITEDLLGEYPFERALDANEEDPRLKQCLASIGESLAKLSLATRGDELAYRASRANWPFAETSTNRFEEGEKWKRHLAGASQWFDALGLKMPSSEIWRSLFLSYIAARNTSCFTHGDLNIQNAIFVNCEPRLIDLEFCAFRHFLYDVSAWYLGYPLTLYEEIKKSFDAECLGHWNERTMEKEWNFIVCYRVIQTLGALSLNLLKEDYAIVGKWTCRRALLIMLKRASELLLHSGETSKHWCVSLSATLHARWA